jgi:DNA-binding beta-propeller fold protein YncE
LHRAVAVAASVLTAGSFALASSASWASSASAATAPSGAAHSRPRDGHALFVLTDDPGGNGVIAFTRGRDGSLVREQTYPTGGLGARLSGAVVDPLASQGALTYDRAHGLLYAVNAGSNTLSVFAVAGAHLRLQQVLASGGQLPVSVSVTGDTVYVLNAAHDASIAGFHVHDGLLHPIDQSVRSLSLPNPADPNFLKSPAQVAVTPDARNVLVTTKTNGTVLVWSLDRDGRPSTTPTVNTVGAVPFALAFDRHGQLLLADAAGTLTSYLVGGDSALALVSGPVADFQAATCWLVVAGGYAYAANAGSATISGFAIGTDGSVSLLAPSGVSATTGPGPIDLAAADGSLYVENGGNGSLSSYRMGTDGSLSSTGTTFGLTASGGTGVEGVVAI